MQLDFKDFWARFRSGIEVAVGSSESDKLLGVRDGFLRYFHDGLDRPVPVAVAPEPDPEDSSSIPLADDEILTAARDRVLELESRLEGRYPFYVCSEVGLHSLDIDGVPRYFARSWTVVRGLGGEAFGGSGSIQLPPDLIEGLDSASIPFVIPGTRRRGGMVASLSGGLETRRRAVALSTLHAISTLLYGVLEHRPQD